MKERRKSPLGDSGHVLNDKDDVTQLLILRFQQLLSEGLLSPGTKLPPERELAANFGVARSSLRPALKVLEIMGVITQKVGDGSYLNKDASSVLSVPMEFLFLLDDTSLQELTEMRLMMEPALAAKAAERANAQHIALLRQSNDDGDFPARRSGAYPAVPSAHPDRDRTAQPGARVSSHDRPPDRCARPVASQPPAGDLAPASRSPRRGPVGPQAFSQINCCIAELNGKKRFARLRKGDMRPSTGIVAFVMRCRRTLLEEMRRVPTLLPW